jgi:hypothetical protein
MLLLHPRLTFIHGKPVKLRPRGRRPHTAIERLVYSTLITIFDTLDTVLCWARPFDKKLEDKVRKPDSPPSFADLAL